MLAAAAGLALQSGTAISASAIQAVRVPPGRLAWAGGVGVVAAGIFT